MLYKQLRLYSSKHRNRFQISSSQSLLPILLLPSSQSNSISYLFKNYRCPKGSLYGNHRPSCYLFPLCHHRASSIVCLMLSSHIGSFSLLFVLIYVCFCFWFRIVCLMVQFILFKRTKHMQGLSSRFVNSSGEGFRSGFKVCEWNICMLNYILLSISIGLYFFHFCFNCIMFFWSWFWLIWNQYLISQTMLCLYFLVWRG